MRRGRVRVPPPWAGRLLTVLAVVAVVYLPMPGVAWAHSRLESTAPAASATVTSAVSEVALTFNEHVHQQFSVVVVHGPGGVSYSHGHTQVIDDVVHQPVYPLRSGPYTVAWRVVSADTHPVQGSFDFTVALPPGLEPSAGPPSAGPSRLAGGSAGGSAPLWPWLLGVAIVVVVAGVAVRLVRRRRG